MRTLVLAVCCLLVALAGSMAQAGNILVVNNSEEIVGLESILGGHDLTIVSSADYGGSFADPDPVNAGMTKGEYMESFDLVVIGNSISSGDFTGFAADWAGLQVPVLSINGWVTRASRLQWVSGNNPYQIRSFDDMLDRGGNGWLDAVERDVDGVIYPATPLESTALNVTDPLWSGISATDDGVIDEGEALDIVPDAQQGADLNVAHYYFWPDANLGTGTALLKTNAFVPSNSSDEGKDVVMAAVWRADSGDQLYGDGVTPIDIAADRYFVGAPIFELGDTEFGSLYNQPYLDLIQAMLDEVGLVGGGLVGDANGDGQVDGNDLISVEENFGATGDPGIAGDANADGQVDGNDLISVEENFGATSGGASVPEPATLMLLALGGLFAAGRRR